MVGPRQLFTNMLEQLDPAVTQALINELCSGRKFMEENYKFREHDAARDAQLARGHKTHKALGKKVLSIPSYDFFRIREKEGDECWHDRGFIRDVQKMAPEMSVFKV